MGHVNETGRGGRQGASSGAAGPPQREHGLDDWLDDISDDDWGATTSDRRRAAPPVDRELGMPEDGPRSDPSVDRPVPASSVDRTEAHRAVVERRRNVAVLVLVLVLGLGVAIPFLLLRGGDESPADPVTEPTVGTTQAPTETSPPTTTTTPSPSPSPTPATPAPGDASAYTLPEGTKLQLGENDPTLVRELQEALTKAGYNPGAADGTFGLQTEAAVTAFQEANGLSVDGRVGPETAAALNSALANG
jgi:hypothetical protein